MPTITPTPLPPLTTPFPPDHLKDRVLLVTGAGDGLGRAAACAAAAHGATVVLLGRTIKKLEATDDVIQTLGGPEAGLYPLNLTGATWGDLAEVAMTLEKTYGRLDGIVHAAAHFKTFARMEDVEPKDWLESLQVNLTAAFSLTRHCLPLLLAAPDASVVFVTDRGGRQAKPFQGAYGISKAAVEMMSAQWALEQPIKRRLRFNTYDPGPMRTGLRLKGYPGEVPEQVPPVADAVPGLLWLLGPGSRGVNGEAFQRG